MTPALFLATTLLTTTPTETTAKVAPLDERRPAVFALSFSPLSTLMAGAVLEGEVRMAHHFTGYLALEGYGLWMGWGLQHGVRWYPTEAFRGFFLDAHFRASDLLIVRHIGGGLEVGSQHRLGRSRWAFLWAVGCDVGYGDYGAYSSSATDVPRWIARGTIIPVPKLRLMLGYQF